MSEDDGSVSSGASNNKESSHEHLKCESCEQELSTKEAYFAHLHAWAQQAVISQNAMMMFPWYLMNAYPQVFQPPVTAYPQPIDPQQVPLIDSTHHPGDHAQPNGDPNADADINNIPIFRGIRILNEQLQTDFITRHGGYEYVVAPYWKRLVAEVIDIVILLLLKVMITYLIVNAFDMDLGFDLDKEMLRKAMNDDKITSIFNISIDFWSFSPELLIIEVVTKIAVCFYEAAWTYKYYGATPGKVVMNLRTLYVEALMPLAPPVQQQQIALFNADRPPLRVLMYPAVTPNFSRSLARAVAKNMIITLLFPMCFVMVFFKHNRTIYDIMTKTTVVEANENPQLRRR